MNKVYNIIKCKKRKKKTISIYVSLTTKRENLHAQKKRLKGNSYNASSFWLE